MPNLIMTKLKGQDHEKAVNAKIMAFLSKLTADDTSPGLHIEKMQKPVDDRVRTGRVDIHLRAVLYKLEPLGLEPTYVYAGTWPHDKAIDRARTRKLQINPTNGIPELIEAGAQEIAPQPTSVRSTATTLTPEVRAIPDGSFLASRHYAISSLTDVLGFSQIDAEGAFAASTEDDLLVFAEGLENAWQANVVLELAVGEPISEIKKKLDIGDAAESSATPTIPDPGVEDERLVQALKHPAAQMQFTFVADQKELQRVIEGGDFGAWRVFLHPEQRRYATQPFNGAFRLTGGAGTGKTVVLLHRARLLAKREPDSRIILTTFTRALADNLRRDLERLDPAIPIAPTLAEAGVSVRGIDQLAVAIREAAGTEFGTTAVNVLGAEIDSRVSFVSNDHGWDDAIDDVDPELPNTARSKTFFAGEYLQVILPHSITTKDEYFAVRRPGRGVALDRKKRAAVWRVVEQYRKNARITGTLSWAELSSVAAAWLGSPAGAGMRADHVLIDEAQDLTPSHWQLMRAIVAEGPDDLFIAEDTHQRIYGQHVVLSRFGIRITGRSRRLTLNYRTTEQNLRFALHVLEGGEYLDSENETEGVAGYRSARRGPIPRLVEATNDTEQLDAIAEAVLLWQASKVKAETIAVLASSNNKAKTVQDGLAQRGVTVALLNSARLTGGQPVVLTMHTAKGMEFSRVVLFDISAGSVPNPWALKGLEGEDLRDAKLRERSLLYVAASRARDELMVTWKGERSELLP